MRPPSSGGRRNPSVAAAAAFGFVLGFWMGGDIVSGIVSGVVAAVVIGLWNLLQIPERLAIWGPVKVRHEPSTGQRLATIQLRHSDRAQMVPVTLEISRRITVERVGFYLSDGPNRPTITKLYNSHNGGGLGDKPLDGVNVDEANSGRWHWQYVEPLLRTKGNTLKIGLVISTHGAYDGHLEIDPTYQERFKAVEPLTIPFYVAEDG